MEDIIFVEKYRPKKFSEVIGCPKELETLVGQNMPHLLFSGSAGIGKTTVSLIIKNKLGCDFLKLNASDERGIDVVRGKVKSFAMTKGMSKGIKIILLDEADYLTAEAQAILRGIIEEYNENCRFILTCNYLSRISDALQSRCRVFSFRNIDKLEVKKRLIEICEKEKITFLEKDIDVIVERSGSDIRKAINNLQVCSSTGLLNVETLTERTGAKELIEMIREGDLDAIRKKCIDESIDYEEGLNQLSLGIMGETISIDNKNKAIKIIAEAMFRMNFTLNKEIQFAWAISEIIGIKIFK